MRRGGREGCRGSSFLLQGKLGFALGSLISLIKEFRNGLRRKFEDSFIRVEIKIMTTKPTERADGTLSSCLEEGAVGGREWGERREKREREGGG